MDAALDDIAFLANSENRVAVFEILVEAPRSRNKINEQVDASRVTIARILDELEAREWITRSGQEYRVTPLGTWVYDEFIGLVDEIEAEQRLRGPLQHFPSDLLTFDVRCLRDAEIVCPGGSDATAVVRRIVEFHRSGDRIRGVTRTVAPVFVENQRELTVRGDTSLELVITPDTLDIIREHRPTARRFRDMVESENTRWFVYEDVPISVGIVNGTVGINLTDEDGVLKGGLLTDDETVRAWAVDLFEGCREQARPVDPDAITV
jgi:predicted transcriptional regulator